MPAAIRKSYNTIHFDKVKSMFGTAKHAKLDADMANKLCTASDLLVSNQPDAKGFVTVKAETKSASTFTLTPEKVQRLTEVVQFLEKQKHDIAGPVADLRAIDVAEAAAREEENKAKIAGKAKPATKKPKK